MRTCLAGSQSRGTVSGRVEHSDACEVHEGRDTDESQRSIAEAIPMARLVRPEEVASVTAWAASSDARTVTGELISIDGGRGL